MSNGERYRRMQALAYREPASTVSLNIGSEVSFASPISLTGFGISSNTARSDSPSDTPCSYVIYGNTCAIVDKGVVSDSFDISIVSGSRVLVPSCATLHVEQGLLAVGCEAGNIGLFRCCDSASSAVKRTVATVPAKEGVSCILFHKAGSFFATGHREEPIVRVWDVRTLAESAAGGCKSTQTYRLPSSLVCSISALSFSPHGRWLAAGTSVGTVHLWDLAEGVNLGSVMYAGTGLPSAIVSLAFHASDYMLFTGDTAGTVRSLDCLSFSYCGRQLELTSGSSVSSICVSDSDKEGLTVFMAHSGSRISAAAWSKDGRSLVPISGHENVMPGKCTAHVHSITSDTSGTTYALATWRGKLSIYSSLASARSEPTLARSEPSPAQGPEFSILVPGKNGPKVYVDQNSTSSLNAKARQPSNLPASLVTTLDEESKRHCDFMKDRIKSMRSIATSFDSGDVSKGTDQLVSMSASDPIGFCVTLSQLVRSGSKYGVNLDFCVRILRTVNNLRLLSLSCDSFHGSVYQSALRTAYSGLSGSLAFKGVGSNARQNSLTLQGDSKPSASHCIDSDTLYPSVTGAVSVVAYLAKAFGPIITETKKHAIAAGLSSLQTSSQSNLQTTGSSPGSESRTSPLRSAKLASDLVLEDRLSRAEQALAEFRNAFDELGYIKQGSLRPGSILCLAQKETLLAELGSLSNGA